MCYKELDKRFAVLGDKRLSKKNRIETTIVNSILPVSKKELQFILPDISVATIEKTLIELQNRGVIEKIGTYKDAKYKVKRK